mgnify:CR=1 FL=1
MADINDMILEKLRKYPGTVAEVAAEAVRAAGRMPKSAVQEYLYAVVRKAVRENRGHK